jgi:phosphoribosylglycinamide formyltransferase-1
MRIGILISGRGSNMQSLIEAVRNNVIKDSEISIVISDKPQAAGLEKAKAAGVETLVIERKNRTREQHDEEIVRELTKRNVGLVCLAGYMRLLSGSFIRAFPEKILNIHPSLLPSFPGLDAQKQALEYGVKISGCTVHFVTEELDAGPIILQRQVPVLENDTVETLSERILAEEHIAYPKAVEMLTTGKYEIRGRRVFFY